MWGQYPAAWVMVTAVMGKSFSSAWGADALVPAEARACWDGGAVRFETSIGPDGFVDVTGGGVVSLDENWLPSVSEVRRSRSRRDAASAS